jgi:hypothetical protein
MRHNKKNTKKAIQRKLTTRKRWKNNRSLPRRTQYKTHKSYKQMRGGFVRTTVGASIIKSYNEVRGKIANELPDIPDKQQNLTGPGINPIVWIYTHYFNTDYYNTNSLQNILQPDEFKRILTAILEGKYSNSPDYTEDELKQFKLLAESLDRLHKSLQKNSTPNREPGVDSRFLSTGFGDKW